MRTLFKIWVVLLFMLCLTVPGQAQETVPDFYDAHTYWATSGSSFTVAWDKVENTNLTEYQWEAIQPEKNFAVLARGTVPQRDNPQFTVQLNKAGHYIFQVRSCSADECSDWTLSTDSASAEVNGNPKSWMIYLYLAPPSF